LQILGSYLQNTQLESLCKLCAMQFAPNHRIVFLWRSLSWFRFGSLERDYSLSKGDMTLEKGLRSQHRKDVQLHNLLGSLRLVNELRTISASVYSVIVISCNKTSTILCKQVLHKCVDSCASFVNQNIKLTTCNWLRILNKATLIVNI